MLKYSYKALNEKGKVQRGMVAAMSQEDFQKVIAEKGLKVFWFRASGKSDAAKTSKLELKLVLAFCRQLSSMLSAGLPLIKSLEMLYERSDKAKLKNVLASLFESVQKGNSLAEAMGGLGDTFPTLLVSMIKSGEMSGQLESTLLRMADYYEKERKQKAQVKSAMSYPKMVMLVCLVVVGVLIQTIMPKMISQIPEGVAMPVPTAILLAIKNFVVDNFFIIGCIVAGIIILKPILRKVEAVDLLMSKMKLRVPIFGKINRMVATSRFASSLATLTSSGVHLIDALTMVTEMMDNSYIAHQLDASIEAIRRGESISVALQNVEAFDPLLRTMIFVGEESGSLDEVLVQTATYFEEESDNSIKRLTAMINPLLMMIMAVIVGFVLIAIMMPMFTMMNNIG